MLSLEEIQAFIDNDKRSDLKRQAQIGRDYYSGSHDIKDYTMFYYNGDGELVIDQFRTNTTISHPFFTELVEQCADYLMSGKNRIVKAENQELQKHLDRYFGDDFKEELGTLIRFLQVDGFGYIYQYANADGLSAFKFAEGMGIMEVDARITSDGQNYVIHYYADLELDGDGKAVEIERVEVWDVSGTYYFVVRDGDLLLDEDALLNPRPHILFQEGERLYYDVFDDIPFFRIDNNKSKSSDVYRVKDIIDDYDIHACSLTNDIQDFAQAVYVVKGYNGTNLDEMQKNIKSKKMIGVGEQGGIEVKTVDIPYEARKNKLELDERSIYKFGFGFNSSQVGDGNITNIVIKSRYALLDLKCNRIEAQLRRLMKELVEIALTEINKEIHAEFTPHDVEIIFERNTIVNELDNAQIAKAEAEATQIRVNTIMSLSALIGEEKCLELIGEEMEIDVTELSLDTLQSSAIDLNGASDMLMSE